MSEFLDDYGRTMSADPENKLFKLEVESNHALGPNMTTGEISEEQYQDAYDEAISISSSTGSSEIIGFIDGRTFNMKTRLQNMLNELSVINRVLHGFEQPIPRELEHYGRYLDNLLSTMIDVTSEDYSDEFSNLSIEQLNTMKKGFDKAQASLGVLADRVNNAVNRKNGGKVLEQQ